MKIVLVELSVYLEFENKKKYMKYPLFPVPCLPGLQMLGAIVEIVLFEFPSRIFKTFMLIFSNTMAEDHVNSPTEYQLMEVKHNLFIY